MVNTIAIMAQLFGISYYHIHEVPKQPLLQKKLKNEIFFLTFR